MPGGGLAGEWERKVKIRTLEKLRVRHPASNEKKTGSNGNPKTQVQKPNLGHRHPAGAPGELDYWAAAFGLKKPLASTSCLGVIRRLRDLRRLEARPLLVELAREYHAYAAT
jgi:hypothetical protein